MKVIKIAGTLLAMILMLFTPVARADASDQNIRLIFNQAVEIPGNKVLPPGTYWFKPVGDDQNVIIIYNADRTHMEALLLTKWAYRVTPTDLTQFTLAEHTHKNPEALLTLFYPGTSYGYEFLYSQRTERRLNEEPKRIVLERAR